MTRLRTPAPARQARIAVVSPSFARNAALRSELVAKYPNVTFTDSASVVHGDALVALLRGHDSAIVGLERIDDEVLSRVPVLRVISKYCVGIEGIDVDDLLSRCVRLVCISGVNWR